MALDIIAVPFPTIHTLELMLKYIHKLGKELYILLILLGINCIRILNTFLTNVCMDVVLFVRISISSNILAAY